MTEKKNVIHITLEMQDRDFVNNDIEILFILMMKELTKRKY